VSLPTLPLELTRGKPQVCRGRQRCPTWSNCSYTATELGVDVCKGGLIQGCGTEPGGITGVSAGVPLPTVDPDLEWLLTVAPSQLGQRSTHSGIVAALEGGRSGAFDSSAAEALCERALPHVARARWLSAAWARLDLPTRKVLTTHYQARASGPPGVSAMLGTVAAVAMAMTRDRGRLELACCHCTLESNQAVIRRD
jgi:hypothetical protein